MKKILLLILFCLLFTGCKGYTEDDSLKKFKNKVESSEQYSLVADMQITSNEETYNYDVNVAYKQGSFYKVSLINKENSHEQIILKNEDGVYVVTPALNKSFKFQSQWPNNSSQAYILETLLSDIEKDSSRVYEENEEKLIFTTGVNYPNNSNLVSQKITFDKEMNLETVEVYDKDGKTQIKVSVKSIDFKEPIEKDFFALENNVDENCCEEESTSSEVDEVIYPMYIPSGTSFESEEVVNKSSKERVILTFTGEKPFILVEEAADVPKDFEISTTSGELVFYENILGSITDTSFNWSDGGLDYYIIGQNLTTDELLQIAASTTAVSITK